MDETLQSAILPLMTVLLALALHAALRAYRSAFLYIRAAVVGWRGRKVLGQLQAEVDDGRRTSFELFMQHGAHHLHLRDPQRARAFFEAAIVAHPLSPHGYFGQSLAHRESHYFSGPLLEQALQQTLERDPDHRDARVLLMEFYLQCGIYEKARALCAELPGSRLAHEALGELVERQEPEALSDQPATWERLNLNQKRFLLVLDGVFVAICGVAIMSPPLFPMALYMLALLLPQHLLWFWRLDVGRDGFQMRSLGRTSATFAWGELLDLVELPEGGFFLHTPRATFFVSRQWNRYGELLLKIKHHLYTRGWVPALKQYHRKSWARSPVR